jgi:hypothetical protein
VGECRLTLDEDELRAITNALNEVLQGPDAVEEREFEHDWASRGTRFARCWNGSRL